MSFSISTSGIIATASATDTPNSARLIVSNPNAAANGGTNMTAEVRTSARSIEPHSQKFCFPSVNTECSRERILNEWKISTRESVRNAIVIPSGLAVISHLPASIKCPMKYETSVSVAIKKP